MNTKTVLRIFRFFYELGDKVEMIASRMDAIEKAQCLAQKRYLSKKEAAVYLDKTTSYVDKMIRGREVTYFQPNPYSIYIDRNELDRYITRTMFRSNDLIKQEGKKSNG